MAGPTINKWGETWATPGVSSHTGEIEYRVVSDKWRERVIRRGARRSKVLMNPMIRALLGGETLFVNVEIPLGAPNPYKSLYPALAIRGYRLQMHTFDDETRGLLMWAEPLSVLYHCNRCGYYEISSDDVKPSTAGCESSKYHSWRKIKKTRGRGVNQKRLQEQFS